MKMIMPEENIDALLTGLREDADSWGTSSAGTPEHELHAAAVIARFQSLDHVLSHGGRFPVPWMDSTRCRD